MTELTHLTPSRGSQNRSPQYEAHLFLTLEADQADTASEILARSGFRLSGRSKQRKDLRLDLIATRNADDHDVIESAMRYAAAELLEQGLNVYRMRLEKMLFDEVLPRAAAPVTG